MKLCVSTFRRLQFKKENHNLVAGVVTVVLLSNMLTLAHELES